MDIALTNFQCIAAGMIAQVGIVWHVYKVIQRSEEEWILTKGKLVEYKVVMNDDPDNTHDMSGKVIETYFGYYEIKDINGESRIHKSSRSYQRK